MANRLRLALLSLVMLLLAAPAGAMDQSQIPPKFGVPWSNTAVAPYVRNIPQASQIGVQNCAASLTDGFPPLTFIPASAGGCPPFGADFNGILRQVTQWLRWSQASAPVFYDAAFSTQIGGYPKGTTLQSSVLSGRIWFSTANNNATNPDAPTAAGWTVLPGTAAPGALIASLSVTPPPNTVPASGGTVGNAASHASRANLDTFWLFSFLWTNCPNAQCQLFNSSGGAIGRGASALADWNDNDAIRVYDANGLGVMGADSQAGSFTNFLAGVPVTVGSTTAPGSILGENLHPLTANENGAHNHSNAATDTGHAHGVSNGTLAGTAVHGAANGGDFNAPSMDPGGNLITINVGHANIQMDNGFSGSGFGHNTVARSLVVYWNLAL